MFATVQTSLVDALGELGAIKTTGVWQGDVEDLLKNVHKLPSAHVVLSAAEFDAPAVIGATAAPAEMLWSVILISQNLRDAASGAADSLALIEAVLAKLTRLNTGFGWLWPLRVQILGAENGKAAYGFHFSVRKEQR